MTSAATVFIVDDDPSVLQSLGRLVKSAGFKVATFASSCEFLVHAKNDDPGCIVLDMQMPELCGFDLQQKLKDNGWNLPIIFLTGHGDISMCVKAIKAGAVDFLTKPCADTTLLASIAQAITIGLEARRVQTERGELRNRYASLTKREREVCCHVVTGHANKQIAYDLGTCVQTIKVHRMRVMEKLNIQSLPDLVRLTEKLGMRLPAPE